MEEEWMYTYKARRISVRCEDSARENRRADTCVTKTRRQREIVL